MAKVKIEMQCPACLIKSNFLAPKPSAISATIGKFDCDNCESFGIVRIEKVKNEAQANLRFLRFTTSLAGQQAYHLREAQEKLTRIAELNKLKAEKGSLSERAQYELTKLENEMATGVADQQINNANNGVQQGVDSHATNT